MSTYCFSTVLALHYSIMQKIQLFSTFFIFSFNMTKFPRDFCCPNQKLFFPPFDSHACNIFGANWKCKLTRFFKYFKSDMFKKRKKIIVQKLFKQAFLWWEIYNLATQISGYLDTLDYSLKLSFLIMFIELQIFLYFTSVCISTYGSLYKKVLWSLVACASIGRILFMFTSHMLLNHK